MARCSPVIWFVFVFPPSHCYTFPRPWVEASGEQEWLCWINFLLLSVIDGQTLPSQFIQDGLWFQQAIRVLWSQSRPLFQQGLIFLPGVTFAQRCHELCAERYLRVLLFVEVFFRCSGAVTHTNEYQALTQHKRSQACSRGLRVLHHYTNRTPLQSVI